jgi:receptor protein-tyrosine kinase
VTEVGHPVTDEENDVAPSIPENGNVEVSPGGFELSDRLALLFDRDSLAAESVSLLVSEILAKHVQLARRGLAFCAPSSGTGCSFLAANVATAMALGGVRTLVIDANFRDPQMHTYFRPEGEVPGLLHVLEGTAQLSDAIQTNVIPNLSVLFAGETSREAGLLSSEPAKALFAECLRNYDLTIVDTAPSSQSADTIRVANMVRYALVLARKNKSYLDDLRKLIADIQQNRGEVLGTYHNDY